MPLKHEELLLLVKIVVELVVIVKLNFCIHFISSCNVIVRFGEVETTGS